MPTIAPSIIIAENLIVLLTNSSSELTLLLAVSLLLEASSSRQILRVSSLSVNCIHVQVATWNVIFLGKCKEVTMRCLDGRNVNNISDES